MQGIEKAKELLNAFASVAGTEPSELWASLVRNSYVDSMTNLVASLIWLVPLAIVTTVFLKRILSVNVDHSEWEEIVLVISATLTLFALIFFTGAIVDDLPVIIDPETHALNKLIDVEVL